MMEATAENGSIAFAANGVWKAASISAENRLIRGSIGEIPLSDALTARAVIRINQANANIQILVTRVALRVSPHDPSKTGALASSLDWLSKCDGTIVDYAFWYPNRRPGDSPENVAFERARAHTADFRVG